MTRTGITLAVIVRDEGPLLKDLLAHHAGLCEAAVVVDTGSRDDSRDIALKAGATVLDFPWCDDFGAARNQGLQAVATPWVLVLDCDERVAARDFSRLRNLATLPVVCYLLPQWNYNLNGATPGWEPTPPVYSDMSAGAGGFLPAWSARLFPAAPAFRYAGCVHEALTFEGAPLPLTRQGDVPIHHYGHLPDYAQAKFRYERNYKLLLAKIKADPQDTATLVELGAQLLRRRQTGLARRTLEAVVTRFPGAPEVHRGRLLLGRILELEGETDQARRQYDLALRDRPDWRPCWVEATRAAISQGDRERTTCLLEQGRRLFPLDPQLKGLEAKVSKGFVRYGDIGAGP